MEHGMNALRISNRDKRIAEYQNTVHALRAENARLREALKEMLTEYDARIWTDPASGGPARQARAALAGRE